MNLIGPLIIDPDHEYLQKIAQDSVQYPFKPHTAISGSEALSILSDPRTQISAVFLNPMIGGIGPLALMHKIHQLRPAIPIFIATEIDEKPFADYDHNRLALQPETYLPNEPLNRLLNRISPLACSTAVTEHAPTSLVLQKQETAGDYVPVSPFEFLSGTRMFFDVYIRIESSNRFLKIANANELFVPERTRGYIDKGVNAFYIRRSSQTRFLHYCEGVKRKIQEHRTAGFLIKHASSLSQAENLIQDIRREGLSRKQIDYCAEYVKDVLEVIHEFKKKPEKTIRAVVRMLPSWDHAIGTTSVAGLLTLPLNIETTIAIKHVGIAALLHDVGLYGLPENIQSEDEAGMNADERTLFHQHPKKGAEILKKQGDLDEVVIQAVFQHHARRDKSGFPQIPLDTINIVSQIIGISSTYVRLSHRVRKNPSLNPLEYMREKVFSGFSVPVVSAFEKIFLEKGKTLLQ